MGIEFPEVSAFDPKGGADREYESLNRLTNRIKLEAMPDDRPEPVEQTKAELQNVPPVVDLYMWVAWSGEREAVGAGEVGILHMETNDHLAQFGIRVLPEYRNHGLGSRLLGKITDVTQREGRRMMMGMTKSTVPAGEAFMKRIGAEVGLATHMNELNVADLNRNILRQWQERPKERAGDFELGLWEGRYPEAELEAIAEMRQSINAMPTDDLDIGDIRWTPEQLRSIDDSIEARGMERWTMYVRDPASGKLAGFSEMLWEPSQPYLAQQGDTAVSTSYQNRGLGRWLKAAMLEKLLTERPGVQKVRTGNAHSNEPMLKINTELGFRPVMTELIWQADTKNVADYLARKGQGVATG